jgi:monoterpene epsilon-lactone hydrolase
MMRKTRIIIGRATDGQCRFRTLRDLLQGNRGDETTSAYATSPTDRERGAMVRGKMSGEEDHGSPPQTLSRWKRWLSLHAYGLVTSALFGATTSPIAMRGRFERFGRVSRQAMQLKFPKLVFGDHGVDGLAIESVCAAESPARVILYLHGGAFFMGSPASYRDRAMRLSYRCQAEVFVPDYRLAPEHQYPAALDDALAAWRLVKALRPHGAIFVAGDSAGGGLSLSLLVRLRDSGLVMPNGSFQLSPWTDLTISGSSVDGNDGRDLWFTRKHLEVWARYYVGQADARSPYVSPAFADLSGLPPLLLLVGEDELLLDDTLRVRDAAASVGTDVRVLIGKGMQHDWPLTLPWLDESKHAWNTIRRFLEAH